LNGGHTDPLNKINNIKFMTCHFQQQTKNQKQVSRNVLYNRMIGSYLCVAPKQKRDRNSKSFMNAEKVKSFLKTNLPKSWFTSIWVLLFSDIVY